MGEQEIKEGDLVWRKAAAPGVTRNSYNDYCRLKSPGVVLKVQYDILDRQTALKVYVFHPYTPDGPRKMWYYCDILTHKRSEWIIVDLSLAS